MIRCGQRRYRTRRSAACRCCCRSACWRTTVHPALPTHESSAHPQLWAGYHLPIGVDLVCSRGVCELAAQKTEAIVAPPLSYGPGVEAVGSPAMGSLELGYREYLPHVQAVLRGLVKM